MLVVQTPADKSLIQKQWSPVKDTETLRVKEDQKIAASWLGEEDIVSS